MIFQKKYIQISKEYKEIKKIIEKDSKIDKGLGDKLNKEFKSLLQERLNEVKQKPLPYKPQKKDEEWNFLRSSNKKDFISNIVFINF